jgi:hypothetical protein
MKIYPWFFCHRDQMWLDSWTYGDWRQYICKRGTATRCAKVSVIPGFIMGFGAMTAVIFALMLATGFSSERLAGLLLGLGIFFGPLTAWKAGWRLMKAVGPMNIEGKRVLASDTR